MPESKIKCKKKSAGQIFYYLSWGNNKDDSVPEDRWVTEDFFQIASEDGELVTQLEDLSCNTKKTKDKRDRRHTVGILVGSKPCGTVVLFNELYGSESVTQVYANVVDYIGNLSEDEKPKVINYDDACHLVKYARNHYRKKKQNSDTKYMTEVSIVVDKFHFSNHVDKWCQEHCNPYKIKELDGVNTESCEQTFHWVNKFTSVKSMNESRFFLFFIAIFDYHNLSRAGQLRSLANPKSSFRWEMVDVIPDFEDMLTQKQPSGESSGSEEVITEKLNQLSIGKYDCEQCGAKYKVSWTLKSHMEKKHAKPQVKDIQSDVKDEKNQSDNTCSKPRTFFVCDLCKEVFFEESDLVDHYENHLVCHICKRECPNKKQLKRHILTHK